MRPQLYLPVAALLLLAAPHVATSQANQPCCQIDPSAKAKPAQPVSTVRGSDRAPITIIVFSDFESFPCARSASVIDGFLQQTRDVRVIFKHAPAASNPNALLAHEAALAAGAQGKFWEMHDTLFENQTHLTRTDLLGYAKSLGLDLAAFERALDNHTYRPIVERDLAEAAGASLHPGSLVAACYSLYGLLLKPVVQCRGRPLLLSRTPR
jgi:protein-disulfide isomerase